KKKKKKKKKYGRFARKNLLLMELKEDEEDLIELARHMHELNVVVFNDIECTYCDTNKDTTNPTMTTTITQSGQPRSVNINVINCVVRMFIGFMEKYCSMEWQFLTVPTAAQSQHLRNQFVEIIDRVGQLWGHTCNRQHQALLSSAKYMSSIKPDTKYVTDKTMLVSFFFSSFKAGSNTGFNCYSPKALSLRRRMHNMQSLWSLTLWTLLHTCLSFAISTFFFFFFVYVYIIT
ncbi:hypothetical protein RFI_13146, partial [Reticulomyxa filosa]